MFLESKNRRARAVHNIAKALDTLIGENVFGRGPHSLPSSRRIIVDAQTTVLLHPGGQIKMRWVSSNRIREVFELRNDCVAMELLRCNALRLQVNVFSDGEVEIYRYVPGGWEQALGINNEGDTMVLSPQLFADPAIPAYLAWLADNPRPSI